ncbi:MAG: GNAT family N-acetyltransferase, partial [Pseudomonadota bacterium]
AVSCAVCVHPHPRCNGSGGRLPRSGGAGLGGRGDRPYLHAVADNVDAIRLYEALGFRIRCAVQVAWLEPPGHRQGPVEVHDATAAIVDL